MEDLVVVATPGTGAISRLVLLSDADTRVG